MNLPRKVIMVSQSEGPTSRKMVEPEPVKHPVTLTIPKRRSSLCTLVCLLWHCRVSSSLSISGIDSLVA